MPRLSDTTARLSQLRGLGAGSPLHAETNRLKKLGEFGSNPRRLRAPTYVPAELEKSPVLVVVLHGCIQTAAGYDVGSGWSQPADRYGFVLLLPEQLRQNNPNVCFNWFSAEDNRREGGDALSIRQMIAAVANQHDIDPARIFVTGLSAGGPMASVMLATYPELVAGGAIIAGLPYGCADTIPEALGLMRGRGGPAEAELARLVRSASDHGIPGRPSRSGTEAATRPSTRMRSSASGVPCTGSASNPTAPRRWTGILAASGATTMAGT